MLNYEREVKLTMPSANSVLKFEFIVKFIAKCMVEFIVKSIVKLLAVRHMAGGDLDDGPATLLASHLASHILRVDLQRDAFSPCVKRF